MSRVLLPLFLLFLVTACATSPEGRSQLVAPAPLQGFSAVYSEFDMHLQLVTAADAPACQAQDAMRPRRAARPASAAAVKCWARISGVGFGAR